MKTKKLAFALSGQVPFYRQIVEGIGEYLQHHPEWELLWDGNSLFWKHPEVWSGGADAVVCGALRPEALAAARVFPGRVISISNFRRMEGLDCVVNDDREAGREAGRHLTRQGFRQLAFLNGSHAFFSAERFAGAREIFESFPDSRVREFILANVTQLPKCIREMRREFSPPFAMYCDSDLPAVKLAGLAMAAGLRIPEDAALLGTDDAPLLCQLCRPRLSSVALDAGGISRAVCRELEKEDVSGRDPIRIEVPPLGVVARHSTDITAIDDPRVARALGLMRARRGRDLTVDAVAREAGISRRVLEIQFKKRLNRSPYQEMLHLRIDHARELLHRSDQPIGDIAEAAGFGEIRAFNQAFRKIMGISPSEYRSGRRGSTNT